MMEAEKWAGRVRIVAAERRVLGLPKPHPPLERPFPPELIRYLSGGVPGVGGVRGRPCQNSDYNYTVNVKKIPKNSQEP